MVGRFILFLILFAIAGAYLGKWIYIYVKKILDKETRQFEKEVIETEFDRLRCNNLKTHNFPNKKFETKCKWCKMTVKEAKEQEKKLNFNKRN